MLNVDLDVEQVFVDIPISMGIPKIPKISCIITENRIKAKCDWT